MFGVLYFTSVLFLLRTKYEISDNRRLMSFEKKVFRTIYRSIFSPKTLINERRSNTII